MGKDFWTIVCGDSERSLEVAQIIDPDSCINHIVIISVDILLLFICLFIVFKKFSSRGIIAPSQRCYPVLFSSAIFNGCLGLVYFGFGIWTFVQRLATDQNILPIHVWLMMLLQGFTWLMLGLSGRLYHPHAGALKLCSLLVLLIAGFLCICSIWEAIKGNGASIVMILDIFCFPGASLFLFCAFWRQSHNETDAIYVPLQSEENDGTSEISSYNNVTLFSRAGFLSRMTFWWLNPLMKKGKETLLDDHDIPELRQADRAQTCYLMFMEQISKRKQKGSSHYPSVLLEIFFWQWKALSVSGLFAFIKVLALSSGPLFLKAFIAVAEGKTTFEYEGYVLTGGLLFSKLLESLSERQWFFRTRLIGLQVRSMLSAAIYKKQLRLSKASEMTHSPGEVMNYVTVDAYKIGEFPYWFHQIWTTSLQLCLALAIVYYSIGLATLATLTIIILVILSASPLAKLQYKYQIELMVAQDKRLKVFAEALASMKVLKLYAWETHFRKVVESCRKEEFEWISAVLIKRGYSVNLFWSSTILTSVGTLWVCYFLGISLNASNVFTFLAGLRLVQEPIRLMPDVVGMYVEAKVSLDRIVKFLEAPELQDREKGQICDIEERKQSIFIRCTGMSWNDNSSQATLRNINLMVNSGDKVAICGEVGSGKSTLLAAILGEVPYINGTVHVVGKLAYVPQTAWIQTGSIQENILFGSSMNSVRYQEVLEKCSLTKDLEMLPFGDLTEIGERGVTLSGGQKQRVQLARALYQNADVYLLDDPFSAVDAHTATSLFNEYVMGALSGKTVLLVTHKVDFLPAFNSILFLCAGEMLTGTYDMLFSSSHEFRVLVDTNNENAAFESQVKDASSANLEKAIGEIQKVNVEEQLMAPLGDQLINKEERESGDTGLKPYLQYLRHGKGFLNFFFANLFHTLFLVGQLLQLYWLAIEVQNSEVSTAKLVTVYSVIGAVLAIILLFRSYFTVMLGCGASASIFSTLLDSLFRAPMSFYDSTPMGRILSRVSSDMSNVDLEIPFKFVITVGSIINVYTSFGVLAIVTWPVVFIIIPMVYLTQLLQKYYFASAKELMRTTGTTKSLVASHLAESIAGSMTIRAFGQEDRFFSKSLDLIDTNASPYFHSFSANEWLVQRLEILCAIVLSSSALALTLFPLGASASGYIGMALSYGLTLNVFIVLSVNQQSLLASSIISVERLEQYMHIPSEAPEVIESNRPAPHWPAVGEVEICNLKVRYRLNSPFVICGISCTFKGGDKIGIVGRTGSGKTTLISTLFRLVEPTEGKIIIDGIDISTIGLHDLRSHFGVIPQDPTLFNGSVRYNLDPLSEHTDQEIWEVLEKCQLRLATQEKVEGLNSIVAQDGSNWSMGQRQLFCLGRALLKKSQILVLDEATASIDNATDYILQKTIRKEFVNCTVITVAHRIPTVLDCNMVLGMSDGKLVEYDEPMKLIEKEDSLFGQLYKEYNSSSTNFDLRCFY